MITMQWSLLEKTTKHKYNVKPLVLKGMGEKILQIHLYMHFKRIFERIVIKEHF